MRRNPTFYALLVLAAALPAAAVATDWSPDTGRSLGDPAFLPLAGQIEGSFGYAYTANLYDYQNGERAIPFFPGAGASPRNSWDRSINEFLPTLSYGITDDVSVSADLNFGNARGADSTTVERLVRRPLRLDAGSEISPISPIGPIGPPFPRPVVVTTNVVFHDRSIGAANPDIRLAWRVIDQRSAPLNLDVTAGYAPDIFQARGASSGDTGSRASGGQRASLQAAVSRELSLLTVRGYATFAYDGRRDTPGAGGFSVDRAGAHPEYAGGVQTEVRLLPWLAINSGVNASRSAQFDIVQIAGSDFRQSSTVKPGAVISPYAGIVFPIVGHRLVGELDYQHDFIGDEHVDSAFTNARYFDQEANIYSARLLFVFNTR